MTPKTYMMLPTMEGNSHEHQISASNDQIVNQLGASICSTLDSCANKPFQASKNSTISLQSKKHFRFKGGF
jgi:hypothetical protein